MDSNDRLERLLRTNRRSLIAVLIMILVAAATLIAHALVPGSLLSDWPSKAPWLIPVGIVLFAGFAVQARRRAVAPAEASALMETVINDEYRQANLARAQRIALVVVLIAQLPLAALALSGLSASAAVTVMATTTVTLGMATTIVSFLLFDRD